MNSQARTPEKSIIGDARSWAKFFLDIPDLTNNYHKPWLMSRQKKLLKVYSQ